jgi:glycosyltransferase involved in cell wall biosynthesis
LDLLFSALAGLKDLAWTLEIVGDGPRHDDLRSQADELGIQDRIKFAGWKYNAELNSAYANANLFTYPSRHEGMPNALLEAMASGLPALATHIAGNEELVAHEQTGLLVPSEDIAALQRALRELIPDATRRQRMGAAAQAAVSARYSWQRIAKEYLELMQQVIK